jgi:hypothetical protein
VKPRLENIIVQRASGKERVSLIGGSGSQRSADIAVLESKVQEDLNPSPELFCSAVIYDENHIYLAVCEKGTKWGKTHEMP